MVSEVRYWDSLASVNAVSGMDAGHGNKVSCLRWSRNAVPLSFIFMDCDCRLSGSRTNPTFIVSFLLPPFLAVLAFYTTFSSCSSPLLLSLFVLLWRRAMARNSLSTFKFTEGVVLGQQPFRKLLSSLSSHKNFFTIWADTKIWISTEPRNLKRKTNV